MENEWHKIIAFNGSQANAFEELVCQVAMAETNTEFETFERVGTPDGGVECYWQLKDNTEWGWQAKYYNDLSSSEWNNIKISLFNAVSTHPKLTQYFVCLPHNLSDGRKGRNTQKALWDKYKAEWIKALTKKGRKVELLLWNSTTIFSKLAKPTVAGTKYFFFSEIEIKESHLSLQLQNSILSLGPKYSASLNLKIDSVAKPFHALSRNKIFKADFEHEIDTVLIKFREVIDDCKRIKELNKTGTQFQKSLEKLTAVFKSINFYANGQIPVNELLKALKEIETNISSAETIYYEIEKTYQEEKEKLKKEKPEKEKPEYYSDQRYKNGYQIEKLQKFSRLVKKFISYLEGTEISAANDAVLMVKGNWGTGKSHLLADIATQKSKLGVPSIFLLGMNFTDTPPRVHIQQTLCPGKNLEDYLAALNSFAQSKEERLFFIIDAINEGKGKFIWKDNINALINEFKNYKWLALIISYRTTYERMLLPDQFVHPRITHIGFKGMEDYAIREFFSYYKIQQTIPLLNPEFSTPLFLKIFCVTLENMGLDKVGEGYEGISKIFNSFVQSINIKIGERLGYPYDKVNLVQKAIEALLQHQLNKDEYVIAYEEAHNLTDAILQKYSTNKNFLEELLKENLLTEDYYYNHDTQSHSKNGISFSYERIIDHFKAQYLLNGKSTAQIKKDFKPKGKIHSLFADRHGIHGLNTGLLNSFAVLLPEKFNIELYEVFIVPEKTYGAFYIYKALLESIMWRRSDTITEKLWLYVREHLRKSNEDELMEFYSVILHVCASKDNYFNSNFIHTLLWEKTVGERDFIWSIPIDKIYRWYDDSVVKRLINWCWSDHITTYNIDDETAIHLGMVLTWFFTSSNRYARDKSTKAFTALFESRVHLLIRLLEEFKDVNDPYVLERLIAGTYGAVARSTDEKAIARVANYIYTLYFKSKNPPVNILTRDYCKAIIESAITKGIKSKFKKENLNPPFKTDFPVDIPDKAWVDSLDIKKGENEKYTDKERGYFKILSSVKDFGDFSRYIIGTNHKGSGSFAAYTIQSRQAFEKLSNSLRGYNKKFLEMYISSVDMQMPEGKLGKKVKMLYKDGDYDKQLQFFKESQQMAKEFLQKNLAKADFKQFLLAEDYIEKDLPYTRKYDRPKFDLESIARYILKRVFDLGWTMDLFGEYDCNVNEHHRTATKAERIGKKYQWIAYYEIMALLTDHYDYLGRYSYGEEKSVYKGAWQEGLRNIDPTVLIKPLIADRYNEKEKKLPVKYWWNLQGYKNWNEPREKWLSGFDDMPDIKKLHVVKDPDTNIEWYNMNGQFLWETEKEIGNERHNAGRKELWIHTYSFIVPAAEKNSILKAGSEALHWLRNDIPENTSYYNIYNGELYNSDAYTEEVLSNKENNGYTNINVKGKPKRVIKTVEEISVGGEYDCSYEKFRLSRPSKFLFELLDARFGKNDSCIYNIAGEIIGIDTSTYYNAPYDHFLIRKDILDKKLQEKNLELIWYFFGEKQDIGANVAYVYRMLLSGFSGYQRNLLKVFPYFEIEK